MRGAIGHFFRRRWVVAGLVLAALAGMGAAGWSHWTTTQLLRHGEGALAAREYAKARDLLGQYLEARPGDARAHLLAARAARRLREYYEARDHLRRCREEGGDTEAIEIEDALIDVQRGDDGPVEWLRARGEKDDELALVILEVLIQHDLDTSQLWQALDGLTRYLARRPDDLQALLGRAFVWERFQYFKDALEDYRAAVAAYPNNERARLHLADTLLVVGPPQDAMAEYRRLADRWPQRPEVRLGLARCYRQLGDADASRAMLDGLLAEKSDHGETLWERGQLALDEGKLTDSERWLRQAVIQMPYDRRVHFSLYSCLLAQKRGPEAEAVNARVAELDADLRRIDQIRHEVMKKPGDAALRYEGAMLFLRNGERQAAVRWLKMAVRLDPGHQPAQKALAEASSPRQP